MGYKFWVGQGYTWWAALCLTMLMILLTPILWCIYAWGFFFPPEGEQWIDDNEDKE